MNPNTQQPKAPQWNTMDDFANSIKQKYPAYQQKDNAELAQRFLAKYPTYQSQIKELNQPQETAEPQKETSFGGKVIRGALRPIAKVAASLNDIGAVGRGEEDNGPLQGPLAKYIEEDGGGQIKRVGHGFDAAEGLTGENIRGLKDSVGTGLELGSTFAGGGAAGDVAGAGVKQGLKQAAILGAKQGAIAGGAAGLGTSLEHDDNLKDTAINTATGVVGGAATGLAVGTVSAGGKAIVDGVKNKIVSSAAKDAAEAGTDASYKAAQKKLNPTGRYTATEKTELLGTQTKTKGKGVFKRDVVDTPITGEHEVVADMHRAGELPDSNTAGQDIAAIRQKARQHDMDIDTYLEDGARKNILVNKNDTKKVFKEVLNKAKRDRVFLSDSSEEKAYRDVMDVMQEEMSNAKGTVSGTRKAVKAFNQRMEDILGKDIYTASGEATTVGKARIQAAKDVRSAMNDYIKKSLNGTDPEFAGTAGNVFKDNLVREARLLSAADEIKYRAGGTLGKSKIQLKMQTPKVKRAIAVLKAAGILGGGIAGLKAITD